MSSELVKVGHENEVMVNNAPITEEQKEDSTTLTQVTTDKKTIAFNKVIENGTLEYVKGSHL